MLLTRQLVKSFHFSRIMSGGALERIIANNRIAEQTLEALKREVMLNVRCMVRCKHRK